MEYQGWKMIKTLRIEVYSLDWNEFDHLFESCLFVVKVLYMKRKLKFYTTWIFFSEDCLLEEMRLFRACFLYVQ